MVGDVGAMPEGTFSEEVTFSIALEVVSSLKSLIMLEGVAAAIELSIAESARSWSSFWRSTAVACSKTALEMECALLLVGRGGVPGSWVVVGEISLDINSIHWYGRCVDDFSGH